METYTSITGGDVHAEVAAINQALAPHHPKASRPPYELAAWTEDHAFPGRIKAKIEGARKDFDLWAAAQYPQFRTLLTYTQEKLARLLYALGTQSPAKFVVHVADSIPDPLNSRPANVVIVQEKCPWAGQPVPPRRPTAAQRAAMENARLRRERDANIQINSNATNPNNGQLSRAVDQTKNEDGDGGDCEDVESPPSSASEDETCPTDSPPQSPSQESTASAAAKSGHIQVPAGASPDGGGPDEADVPDLKESTRNDGCSQVNILYDENGDGDDDDDYFNVTSMNDAHEPQVNGTHVHLNQSPTIAATQHYPQTNRAPSQRPFQPPAPTAARRLGAVGNPAAPGTAKPDPAKAPYRIEVEQPTLPERPRSTPRPFRTRESEPTDTFQSALRHVFRTLSAAGTRNISISFWRQ
jgi:hypothetical protein